MRRADLTTRLTEVLGVHWYASDFTCACQAGPRTDQEIIDGNWHTVHQAEMVVAVLRELQSELDMRRERFAARPRSLGGAR